MLQQFILIKLLENLRGKIYTLRVIDSLFKVKIDPEKRKICSLVQTTDCLNKQSNKA